MADNAEAVALARQSKGKGQPKQKKAWAAKKKNHSENDILDQPCQVHTKRDEDGNLILPKHTTRECRLQKQAMVEDGSDEKDEDDSDGGKKKHASGYPTWRKS